MIRPATVWARHMSPARVVGIGLVAVLCVGLYAVDYRVATLAVSTLSVLHVVMELPLNVRTLR